MTRTHKEVTACLGPGGSADRVERALAVVTGRWKLPIIFHLFAEPSLRFNELEKALAGISHRMLTLRLRELEADGLVARDVLRLKPLEVAYRLTKRGDDLRVILRALRDWS